MYLANDFVKSLIRCWFESRGVIELSCLGIFCCLMFAIIKYVYDGELFAGVRDYIHVVDLAAGHVAALKKLKDNCRCQVLEDLHAVQTILVAF